jgi:hypothetical protein
VIESGSVTLSLILNRSLLSLGLAPKLLYSAVVVAIYLALGISFDFFGFSAALDFSSHV